MEPPRPGQGCRHPGGLSPSEEDQYSGFPSPQILQEGPTRPSRLGLRFWIDNLRSYASPQAILEYVENPGSVPRNAAWFYVILLFVSGVVNALSSGQALWKGRKVCIRLRAIIIGEIYGKALRRRAAASPDKVLGEEQKKTSNDEPKKSWMKKITTLGRKTKADDTKTDASKKPEDDSQVSSGAIINLMAVDSFKVAEISGLPALPLG